MEKDKKDEMIKEILKEDELEIKKNGKKRKSCFARVLILLIVLLIAFLAFIFIQQYLLDLEAQAVVSAARTATAQTEAGADLESHAAPQQGTLEPQVPATAEPSPTATYDPILERTATVAAQLTAVAEFQQSITSEP